MISLNKIWLEGFGSYIKETKFKLNRPGLNIIIAENGSGKTTTFSGVRWVLYGTSLKVKDVQTWHRFRTEDFKGTKGRLTFHDDTNKYEVIRCQEYSGKVDGAKGGSRLLFYVNGVKCTKRNKLDVQAEINKVIGYSDRLFINAILFGQKMKRLVEENGPDKKKVFDEAFETSFIKEGKDKADKKLKDLRPIFHEADKKWAIALSEINTIKSNIEIYSESEAEAEEKHRATIANVKRKWEICIDDLKYAKKKKKDTDVGALEKKLDNVKSKLGKASSDNINKASTSAFNQERLVTSLQGQWDDINFTLNQCTDEIIGLKKKCPICGNKLSKKQIAEEQGKVKEKWNKANDSKGKVLKLIIEAQKESKAREELLSSLKANKDNIIQLEQRKKRYEIEIKSYNDNLNHIKQHQLRIDEYQEEMAQLESETLTSKIPALKKTLKKKRNAFKETKELYISVKKEIEDLTWISNEVLSNKGLKSYIFDTSLRNLNAHLRYYEQFIGWRVEFNIDFDSANKDIYALCYQGDHFAMYEELSGGQQQLVNIVTAFALHDMTTIDKPINILVLDEVFEGLDAKNVDIVNDLIKEKANNKCLFLITHNLDLQNAGDKVIRMKYKDGQTILKSL